VQAVEKIEDERDRDQRDQQRQSEREGVGHRRWSATALDICFPLVPAKAGTQFFGQRTGCPLSRA
jgi:hypothetical protein